MKDLFSYIQRNQGQYYVVEDTDTLQILGGGGYIRREVDTLKDYVNNPFFNPIGKTSKIAGLEKIYFLPKIRGTGLASELLHIIKIQATNAGFQSLYVTTEPSLTRAIRFYEKVGFVSFETNKKNSVCMKQLLSPLIQPKKMISRENEPATM
jgi:putative acetyltransferase